MKTNAKTSRTKALSGIRNKLREVIAKGKEAGVFGATDDESKSDFDADDKESKGVFDAEGAFEADSKESKGVFDVEGVLNADVKKAKAPSTLKTKKAKTMTTKATARTTTAARTQMHTNPPLSSQMKSRTCRS